MRTKNLKPLKNVCALGAETPENRWDRCVNEAKLLIVSRDAARIRICELTLEACGEITWGGGGHWSGYANQLTVTKFANEVGIKPRTLLEWLAVKRYVHDHLKEEYKGKAIWNVMAKVRKEMAIKRDEIPSKQKVTCVYEKILSEKDMPGNAYNVRRYLGHLKYSLDNLACLSEMGKADIEDIQYLCKAILKRIKSVECQ